MRFRSRGRRGIQGLLLLCLAFLGSAKIGQGGTLVERTLAFINKKPVLLSDVLLTKALLPVDEATALERTIDEVLMFEEASRLLGAPQEESDVDAAAVTLREKAGPAFSEAALRRKAQTQLSIAAYIELRLRPLVRVEDAEVRKILNEKVVSETQPPVFGEIAPAIREGLERRALDQKIEEWVSSLRLRAEIRRPPPRP